MQEGDSCPAVPAELPDLGSMTVPAAETPCAGLVHPVEECMHKRNITAAALAAATVLAGAVATAGTAAATPTTKAIAHTKPAWTAHAKHLGAAGSTAAVKARVYLAPRGGLDSAKALATAMATPGSAHYQKFISPA